MQLGMRKKVHLPQKYKGFQIVRSHGRVYAIPLSIDPEDLQAHYNLMLCYNGLSDEAKAEAHKIRYLRFKADESSQAITGPYRQNHPEDNNERQSVHEHVSVALNAKTVSAAKKSAAVQNNQSRVSSAGKD